MSDRKYLFEYRYDGAVYGFDVVANSEQEAKARLSAMGLSRYCGEIHATIPVPGGSAILRAWNWLSGKR